MNTHSTTHIINWGMGVESSFAIARWISEPETCPFEWKDAIVLVAQTGDEYEITKQLCEAYILPLLRSVNARLVQVAKAGIKESEGYEVLEDSNQPYELFTEGSYKLSANMEVCGYIVRLNRPHQCAIKWKGWVLDSWIKDNVVGAIGPYLFYNCDEKSRAQGAQDYGCQGTDFRFPMIEEEQSREFASIYLFKAFGVIWHKSCCVHCPFQGKSAIEHWREDPRAGAATLWYEYLAMALNPRMQLFSSKSALSLCVDNQLNEAISLFEERLNTTEQWAVYEVRRIYKRSKVMVNADRCVKAITYGSRREVETYMANQKATKDSHDRLYFHERKEPKIYPDVEAFFVAAPAIIQDKVRSAIKFEQKWLEMMHPQLSLFTTEEFQNA